MDAAAVHWHSSLHPLPLTDDFTREEEESNTGEHEDGSGGVLWGEDHEMWRSRMKGGGGLGGISSLLRNKNLQKHI